MTRARTLLAAVAVLIAATGAEAVAHAVLWKVDLSTSMSGFIVDALPLENGGVRLLGIASDAETFFGGQMQVWVGEVDASGKLTASRVLPGENGGLFGPAADCTLLVGADTAWKVLRLDPKLEVRTEQPVDRGFTPLLWLRSAAVSVEALVAVDLNDKNLRVSLLGSDGAIEGALDIAGVIPSPNVVVVPGAPGEAYLVAPTFPTKDAAGALDAGLTVVKLRVRDDPDA